ncbi:hypothetical protein [Breoghania sp. JC706]|uniref:hypothetical protein n=1 Tax=Breoghania sp. JC706 TaxID=3117732 RepID=UPI003009FD22
MSALRIALNAQPRALSHAFSEAEVNSSLDSALAFPAELSGEPAGLVFDLLLAVAARDARCLRCPAVLLPDEERDQRRSALIRLWQGCSSRIIDESLVADLVARRGPGFLALAAPRPKWRKD